MIKRLLKNIRHFFLLLALPVMFFSCSNVLNNLFAPDNSTSSSSSSSDSSSDDEIYSPEISEVTQNTNSSSVYIRWNSVSGAEKYYVYMGTSTYNGLATKVDYNGYSYTSCTVETNGSDGETFYFWVTAYKNGIESEMRDGYIGVTLNIASDTVTTPVFWNSCSANSYVYGECSELEGYSKIRIEITYSEPFYDDSGEFVEDLCGWEEGQIVTDEWVKIHSISVPVSESLSLNSTVTVEYDCSDIFLTCQSFYIMAYERCSLNIYLY